MSATLQADDFRRLISAVGRFPAAASFAGSDQLNLRVRGGISTATTYGGTVSSWACAPGAGDLELISLPRKKMEDFAASIAERAAKVSISVFDTTVVLACKGDTKEERLAAGQRIKRPGLEGQFTALDITDEFAQRIRYLSGVCDTSRPELECVMLSKNQAIACSQQAVASLTVGTVTAKDERLSIPTVLAKAVKGGEMLYLGLPTAVLVEKDAVAVHSTPFQVEAQKNFPLKMVQKIGSEGLAAAQQSIHLECEGVKFSNAIAKCAMNMAAGAGTELIASLSEEAGKIVLEVRDDTSKYVSKFTGALQHGLDFRIPLAGLIAVRPFLEGKVTLCKTERGDTFMGVKDGWIVFPQWLGKE